MTSVDLDTLACRLFFEFARTEYALKAAGFHTGDGDAKPNWDKFAKSVCAELESDSKIQGAIAYFAEKPPQKQVIRNKKLKWDPCGPRGQLCAKELLVLVRRVRNNLVHGGKFNGHWFAPDRSKDLLIHSLDILEACRRVSAKLNEAYKGNEWGH